MGKHPKGKRTRALGVGDAPTGITPRDASLGRNDLQKIQEDSEKQGLPVQEKVFAVARRVRSRLTNLPDPTHAPLGFVPGRGFDVVFPFIRLPELRPTLNGDWVQFGSPDLAPNLLYHGDNLQVLRTLPSESIDLIYIDPPFFSGAEYNVIWGDANEVRTFNDIWEGGLDTYLIWLNARLWEMRRVLKSTGSIYVHCDWHASHYIKAEMDKIFGYEDFRNAIVWQRTSAHSDPSRFGVIDDSLLFYTKTGNWIWNKPKISYEDWYIERYYRYKDPSGRRWKSGDLTAPGGRGPRYEWKGIVRAWRVTKENMQHLEERGKIFYTENGIPRLKQYLDEAEGLPLQTIWTDILPVVSWDEQGVGYPTQKPEALMSRILSASSPANGVVADFFCGGGSFLVAAQAAGLRWIGCDSSRVAISVTLDRLVKVCEEQSGVESNYGMPAEAEFQTRLDFVKQPVPDIRLAYVGVYPIDRFKSVDQRDFDRFILQCFEASPDTTDEPISGWRNQLEPVLVGPTDPDAPPDLVRVKEFFEVCLRHLQPNARLRARVLAWKFSPRLNEYRKTLLQWISKNLPERGVAMELDYVPINSQEFRERILKKYPEASDNEFFLRFTQPPIIGEIIAKTLGARRYRFEAADTYSTNLDGYLVNCQWDFDYRRGHFAAHPEFVLGRREVKGKEAAEKKRKFEAVLHAEHEFAAAGRFTVACRVQDNLGGEAIAAVEINVQN